MSDPNAKLNDDVRLLLPSKGLKAPVARLRGSVRGYYCFSPCEIETGTEVRFNALLSGAYGDDNNITEYS